MSAEDRNDDRNDDLNDDRKNGPKRLLPELLPAPSPVAAALSPTERVAERARLFLQRFRGLGTAAGAAVLSLQCGYGVVDPLPPPPAQCSASPNPFGALTASAQSGARQGGLTTIVLELRSAGYPPNNFVGYRIDAVRVTGGTLVATDDRSQTGQGGFADLLVTLLPESATATMLVEVDLGCGAAVVTKHYRVMFTDLAPGSLVVVTEAGDGSDGGAPDGGAP